MSMLSTADLQERGIVLPTPAVAPGANYLPYTRQGDLIFTAGQVPWKDGKIQYIGKVGREFNVQQAYDAARLCALNVVAHVNSAVKGDLDRVVQCLKLVGFINCVPEFVDLPTVTNGGSDVLVEIFGDRGRPARSSVGVSSLPFGVPVEFEAIFLVR